MQNFNKKIGALRVESRFAFIAVLKAAIFIFLVYRGGVQKDRNLNRKNSRTALRGRGKDPRRPKCFIFLFYRCILVL